MSSTSAALASTQAVSPELITSSRGTGVMSLAWLGRPGWRE